MIKIRIIFACLIAPLLFGQLVSCSSMSAANKSLYALDAGRPTPAPPRDPSPAQPVSSSGVSVSRDQILQIRRVNISPPYDGLSLIYRKPDGTYVKDYYNEWAAPPEELFSTQQVEFLGASSAFASVVDGRSAAPHRYELETCITSLYGDFHDAQHPRVVLRARVYLIDDTSGSRTVAYQNHYDIAMPLAGASAHEMVLGAGSAYRQLLESIAKELTPFSKATVAAKVQ